MKDVKLIDQSGFEIILELVKTDIQRNSSYINTDKLIELSKIYNKNSISELIEDLYMKVENKKELPPFTINDDGKVFGVSVVNNVANTTLIDIEEKLLELINNNGDIQINTEWGNIKNKPLIASKLAFDNEGLKLLDAQENNIHTLNALLTEQEVDDILNNLN